MKYFFTLPLLFLSLFSFAKEDWKTSSLYVQLKDPEYYDGTMHTEEGGVLEGEGIRLQAKKISYTQKRHEGKSEQFVRAEKDLVLDYHGQIFVADECEYNFTLKEGVLKNVRFSIEGFMIHSEQVLLHPDRSLEVFKASITTSDNDRVVWEMTAKYFTITADQELSTKGMTFKALNIPIFWIPGFKANLKSFADQPVRYSFYWDSGQNPKISMRYRAYSYQNFNLYLRGDYQYAKGLGGALEMDYASDDKRTSFQSKNYLSNETYYNDDNSDKKMKRFRIQGLYETRNKENTAEMFLSYDKISDKNLPQDFISDDFELNTAKRTHVLGRYFHHQYLAGINIEPRINSFQGFKQELPHFNLNVKPLNLGSSGLILENRFKGAYLDYVYSDDLDFAPLYAKALLRDFHSVRVETEQNLYYPLHLSGFDFNPYGGFKGIIYSRTRTQDSAIQTVFTYGGKLSSSLEKPYTKFSHVMTPYAQYEGYSKPSKSSDTLFIFSLDDGFHRLNMLKLGFKNALYEPANIFTPAFLIDPYALMFFGNTPYHTTIPKAGVEIESRLQNLFFYTHLRWNFNNNLLDIGNVMLSYTFNQQLAFKIEYRHRSRFDFRKDQHENYILDVTRSLDELLDSPLSDGRNVILTKAEIKLTPTFTMNFQTHQGWGRKNEPGYTEAKVDFLYLFSSSWRLKVFYMHTTRGTNHVGLGIDLIK